MAHLAYGIVALVSLSISWWSWPVTGTLDVEGHWLPWLATLSRSGLVEGYAAIVDDYPPGTATLLFLARRLLPTASDMAVLKSLIACAQLGSALLFMFLAGRVGLSLLYVVAVALSASFLGYLDILFAIPLIASFFAALNDRPILSASTFGIACFIKWQPLIVLPFMVVVWFGQAKALPRGQSIAATALLPTAAIAVASVFWPEVWKAFRSAFDQVQWSAEALNFPWLVQIVLGYGVQNIDAPVVPLIVLRVLFGAIYLLLLVTAALHYRNDPARMMTFGLAGYVAYFTFAPSVHENHLFLAMLLAFVLWSRSPRLGMAAMSLAIYMNLNLACFYGVTGESPLSGSSTFALLTGVISAVGVMSFICALYFSNALPTGTIERRLSYAFRTIAAWAGAR
jgi:hypothetical protein